MRFFKRVERSIYKRMFSAVKFNLKLSCWFLNLGCRSENQLISDFARSKFVLYGNDLYVQQHRILDKQRLALWWTDTPHPGNLGDSLNPVLVKMLTGVPPVRAEIENGTLMCIGSTVGKTKANDVWGSGIISLKDHCDPAANYFAVRGPITRDKILSSGGQCPETYGDPALLLPLFIKPKTEKVVGRVGVISHYQHAQYDFKGAFVISVNRALEEDFEVFVDEIASCEFAFSSSLHGLILCRAYGIPCARIIFDDNPLSGDDIKFQDYRLGVGLKLPDFITVEYSSVENWGSALVETLDKDETAVIFNHEALLQQAPFKSQIKDYDYLIEQTLYS